MAKYFLLLIIKLMSIFRWTKEKIATSATSISLIRSKH
jgi:hypothetical protein